MFAMDRSRFPGATEGQQKPGFKPKISDHATMQPSVLFALSIVAAVFWGGNHHSTVHKTHDGFSGPPRRADPEKIMFTFSEIWGSGGCSVGQITGVPRVDPPTTGQPSLTQNGGLSRGSCTELWVVDAALRSPAMPLLAQDDRCLY